MRVDLREDKDGAVSFTLRAETPLEEDVLARAGSWMRLSSSGCTLGPGVSSHRTYRTAREPEYAFMTRVRADALYKIRDAIRAVEDSKYEPTQEEPK